MSLREALTRPLEEIMPPNLLEPHGGISMFIFMRKLQQPSSVCTLQPSVLPTLLSDPAVLESSKSTASITNITELCFSCWMEQNSLYFWLLLKAQAKPHTYQLDCENVLLELPMDSNLMTNCLHAVERHNRMLLPLFILWNSVWESELVNQQFVLLALTSAQRQEWISSLCFCTGSFAKGLLFTMSVSCALALIVPVTPVWRLFILLCCNEQHVSLEMVETLGFVYTQFSSGDTKCDSGPFFKCPVALKRGILKVC